uniref:EOG090X02D0 n=1 Tax=Ceriodaphnia reticulata TaxID=302197 RepID=A0A4Y7LV81_9CRUS|nr:EOG090X02D0 [Ceriodaphnia reticulata]SVE72811.1 EOG090X02D0 [Ceriodaphnia reticulata]
MANISRARSRKRAKGEICHLVSPIDSSSSLTRSNAEQPLNLCVRDESLPVLLTCGTITEEQVPRNPTIRRRKKRSAIFLPPEKLADNDVCICKFKFVAGHTPRLQEKKILSLDSGGNFRFFPELQNQEQPQQQEKRKQQPVSSPQPSAVQQPQQSQQLAKPIPDLLPIETVRPTWCDPPASNSPLVPTPAPSSIAINHNSGSRRLSRRQKMEQTFGDKGFLIQTQHVPATEGSAFCKFRQLKKFTRYLYRSWRHYLPEESQTANSPTMTTSPTNEG